MIAIAVIAMWGAYGVTTWGWILVKGYNITFADWFNPMRAYEWTDKTPPSVPAGSLFPTSSGAPGISTSATGATIKAGAILA